MLLPVEVCSEGYRSAFVLPTSGFPTRWKKLARWYNVKVWSYKSLPKNFSNYLVLSDSAQFLAVVMAFMATRWQGGDRLLNILMAERSKINCSRQVKVEAMIVRTYGGREWSCVTNNSDDCSSIFAHSRVRKNATLLISCPSRT